MVDKIIKNNIRELRKKKRINAAAISRQTWHQPGTSWPARNKRAVNGLGAGRENILCLRC